MRAMVQKDHTNAWQITGLAARVGVKGRVTTNLHTGGKAKRLDDLLASIGFKGDEISDITANIKNCEIRLPSLWKDT